MEKLKVHVEFGELAGTFEGEFNDVWKMTSEFLAKVCRTFGSSSNRVDTASTERTVKDLLLDLRDEGFFDSMRSTHEVYVRLNELGKTDMTRNAVSMALKNLVAEGRLQRKSNGKGYLYGIQKTNSANSSE